MLGRFDGREEEEEEEEEEEAQLAPLRTGTWTGTAGAEANRALADEVEAVWRGMLVCFHGGDEGDEEGAWVRGDWFVFFFSFSLSYLFFFLVSLYIMLLLSSFPGRYGVGRGGVKRSCYHT